MSAPSWSAWITLALARLRTANPYIVDSALAALVLFAASLQWMFPDKGDDLLTWQGRLLAAATAVPLVWWSGSSRTRIWPDSSPPRSWARSASLISLVIPCQT